MVYKQRIQENKEKKYNERINNIERKIEEDAMLLRCKPKNDYDRDDPMIVSK